MTDSPKTVLVVDDDPFTAELTAMLVEMAGYETVLAEGGVDALEKLEAQPGLAAVVSDMNMPMMSGAELFGELRRQGFRQPFLLITGEEAEKLRGEYPEMSAVLTKDEELQENLPDLLASIVG
jgi:CheY-like chemotaxis protein